jgi:hypothetical protein
MLERCIMICALACALCGCGDQRVYLGDGKLYQVALTPSTPPVFASRDGALYMVETRASLPLRQPSPTELHDLQMGVRAWKHLPFSRLPWIERGDEELQVDFSLSNLDDTSHDVDVVINGANEFDEYFPGVAVVANNPVPMHAQWERTYTLAPKSRQAHTVREEELDEAAVDLATVVNGAPNPDEVVYFENKSSSDPRSQKYIPAVIPGLIALRLGLRATQTGQILLEATVRVRDVAGKLAQSGDTLLHVTPRAFHAMPPQMP